VVGPARVLVVGVGRYMYDDIGYSCEYQEGMRAKPLFGFWG
jgi:hypothetical protein